MKIREPGRNDPSKCSLIVNNQDLDKQLTWICNVIDRLFENSNNVFDIDTFVKFT